MRREPAVSHEDTVRLMHMLDAARRVNRFCTGLSASALANDEMRLLAVVKSIEIIGEASTKISAATQDTIKGIDWIGVRRMRNRLIHGYDTIDVARVWDAVEIDIPPLITSLEDHLQAVKSPEPHPAHTRAAHWQTIYQTKPDHETSWFQADPSPSLELITKYAQPNARIIDIGGGASLLGQRLLDHSFNVTVLDISGAATERARNRMGDAAARINWINADITHINNLGRFDLWHDRAVFHFLTDAHEQRHYIDLAARTINVGGHLIIATFGLAGPEKCSGLPVQRYSRPQLATAFAPAFTLIESFDHTHTTPWGKPQQFFFAVMQRFA